ncbi:hypothetical protein [Frankia sp. AgB32]|uniref:hypothetical protein n=1 Tax=Frankia sp. AgB32 TaxID=631119 RepID=UPI00200EC5B2|nr:hypothetical protein [Frankia sp. AgB32]MCK9896552.1 hypothetical protein [Frankia sp. AgB32]
MFLSSFARLEERLDRRFGQTGADLQAVAAAVRDRVPAAWDRHREVLAGSAELQTDIGEWIARMLPRLASTR